MPKRYHIGYTVIGTIEVVATNEDEARQMVREQDAVDLVTEAELLIDYTVELRDGR